VRPKNSAAAAVAVAVTAAATTTDSAADRDEIRMCLGRGVNAA